MSLYSDYANIIVNSLVQIREGDAVSINTEESDFEFAKILADVAVKTTKTTVKIVLTDNGRPNDVVDFDPYERPVDVTGFCMIRLRHEDDEITEQSKMLDVIVEKDDLRAIQKLGHLADPVILDRRISIPWCVVPSYYANSKKLKSIVEDLSKDFETKVLSSKYRKKFLNHSDIDKFHFFSDKCDFTVDIPENVQFINGQTQLSSGREFLSGTDFQRLLCNVDKNSLNGWFYCTTRVFCKDYNLKLSFKDGILVNDYGCKQLENFLLFDDNISKPGYIELDDKFFSITFGCSCVESLKNYPENNDMLPEWFNDSVYKFSCILDEKLNISYFGCDEKEHELVRRGFFLE